MLFHYYLDRAKGVSRTYCDDCLPRHLDSEELLWKGEALEDNDVACDICGAGLQDAMPFEYLTIEIE